MFKKHAHIETVVECEKHCVGLVDEASHEAFHRLGEDVAYARDFTRSRFGIRHNGQVKFIILSENDTMSRRQLRGHCFHPSRLSADDEKMLRTLLVPLFTRLKDLLHVRVHGLGEKDIAFDRPFYTIDLEAS